MAGVEDDLGGAGVAVDGEHAEPGCAAVGGAVDAALVVGAVGMAEDGGEEAIGVARIDGEVGNLLAVAKAEMGPGFAGIGGAVDAITDGEVGTVKAFAGSDVDDVGVGGSDCDCADGLRGLVVEDGVPGAAVVVGLPDTTVHLTDVEDIGLGWNPRGGAGTTTAEWADEPPAHVGEWRGGRLSYGCGDWKADEQGNEKMAGIGTKAHWLGSPEKGATVSQS